MVLFSSSIHYLRSVPEMWPGLIQKAKVGGLDVIQTYVFWNGHEPSPGKRVPHLAEIRSRYQFQNEQWTFQDSEERTLLHWAVDCGHQNVVEWLVSRNADVNAQVRLVVLCEAHPKYIAVYFLLAIKYSWLEATDERLSCLQFTQNIYTRYCSLRFYNFILVYFHLLFHLLLEHALRN
ncbi:uncharacterized protein LOC131239806 isoform X2 [Magnolia sinica]|uniref:uncharacterized protein LOC131239806 isoform X2 n=1 Tax=Magnolia sinica TaxID=86752 RepID=UPI0026595E3F|nr:uncharacterized protein LOC131239806 isoform X2 [Magnolia sinica]